MNLDVPPPWYSLSVETCSGRTRICPGGDTACREGVARDGYVAISNYEFCRRDDLRTLPRPAGVAVLLGVLLAAALAVRSVRRLRQARSG
jgi:hypothetical protein